MINIKIMCVGKIKDKSLLSLINEYQKEFQNMQNLKLLMLKMKNSIFPI